VLKPASAAVNSLPMGGVTTFLFGQTSSTFALSNGSFTVTAPNGDYFGGNYTGVATVSSSSPIRATASLDLNVSTGTGAFAGAQGSVSGVGNGAFSGEGPFSLGLDGFISTTADRRFHVKVDVTGTSSASCTTPIILTLNGTGVAAKVGNVQTAFAHQVGNTGCGS
jgi:hypothetical protein